MTPRREALVALGALLLTGTGAAPASARDQERTPPPSGMVSKLFEVKHLDPDDLVRALRPLSSGVKGALVEDTDAVRAITVRDFPENVSAIEQAIKRLDVPTPPRPDVELKIRVLLGSPAPGPGQVPSELDAVVKQLTSTLNYKSYFLVASTIQRVRAGGSTKGRGNVEIAPPAADQKTSGQFRYYVDNVSTIAGAGGGAPVMQLRKLELELDGRELGKAEVETGLTLREGEKVVVGTASLKNRAMIVVVSARLLK